MTSSTASTIHRLDQLPIVLRDANERSRLVAESIRRSFRPTHHARQYAAHLGLSINIRRAVACPQRAISHVPLPLIDTVPSPALPVLMVVDPVPEKRAATRGRTALKREPVSLSISIPAVSQKYRARGRSNATEHVPMDQDWEDISLDSGLTSSSGSSSSDASSPITPEDAVPMLTGSKRKSAIDEDDCEKAEKRPKYESEYSSWTLPIQV